MELILTQYPLADFVNIRIEERFIKYENRDAENEDCKYVT
jgi:hypothetical protein